MSAELESDIRSIALEGMICGLLYRYGSTEREIADSQYGTDRYARACRRLHRQDAGFRRLVAMLRRQQACVLPRERADFFDAATHATLTVEEWRCAGCGRQRESHLARCVVCRADEMRRNQAVLRHERAVSEGGRVWPWK